MDEAYNFSQIKNSEIRFRYDVMSECISDYTTQPSGTIYIETQKNKIYVSFRI